MKDPKLWPEFDEFQMLAYWCSELQVTNDGSERAVKDAQEVANASFSQKTREDIMLVKGEHRRKLPKLCKMSLFQMNN